MFSATHTLWSVALLSPFLSFLLGERHCPAKPGNGHHPVPEPQRHSLHRLQYEIAHAEHSVVGYCQCLAEMRTERVGISHG